MGAWFTPPVDYDEMAERIGLNDRYEEYAIHDYELPFEIDEYTPIEEVNRLCEMVEDLPEDIQDELSELLGYYSSLEDLCEHADDIIHYPDCDDMTDVAYYFIDECQSLGEIPDRIRSYIDYEAYGRDLDLPRTAQAQYDATQHIPLSQAKAGDLVFFHSTYNAGTYVTHVGIYAGNNRMYHAGDPIGYADLTSSYWQQHLIGAGRVKTN